MMPMVLNDQSVIVQISLLTFFSSESDFSRHKVQNFTTSFVPEFFDSYVDPTRVCTEVALKKHRGRIRHIRS